jgi:hypothetical protein
MFLGILEFHGIPLFKIKSEIFYYVQSIYVVFQDANFVVLCLHLNLFMLFMSAYVHEFLFLLYITSVEQLNFMLYKYILFQVF